jgi:hypothetical protein
MKRLVLGLFILLLLAAIYFYQERVLFSDAAYMLFRIVNLNSLQIQEHRYGSFITQAFPLLGSRIHLSIQSVAFLYSISFNLFYLAVASLLLFRYKQTGLAVLMSFYFLLFASDTWFWTNNEVHQGICWMFVFLAITLEMGRKKRPLLLLLPLFVVLGILSIFTHPLVMFPLIFLWLFLLLQPGWPFSKNLTIILTVILVLTCLSKMLVSTHHSPYDAAKLESVNNISIKRIIQAFYSPMAKEIVKRTLVNYWLVPILFFAGIYACRRKNQWRVIMLTTVFCLVYFAAICLVFTDFIPFYTESEWMPLSIIATAPFVYYLLPRLKEKTATILLAFIFSVRLVYIGASAHEFIQRKEFIANTLQTMRDQNCSKGLVTETKEDKKLLLLSWGLPAESHLASALAGDQPQLTFAVGSREDLDQRIPGDTHQFISCFENWEDKMLNHRYFSIDTIAQYRYIR